MFHEKVVSYECVFAKLDLNRNLLFDEVGLRGGPNWVSYMLILRFNCKFTFRVEIT